MSPHGSSGPISGFPAPLRGPRQCAVRWIGHHETCTGHWRKAWWIGTAGHHAYSRHRSAREGKAGTRIDSAPRPRLWRHLPTIGETACAFHHRAECAQTGARRVPPVRPGEAWPAPRQRPCDVCPCQAPNAQIGGIGRMVSRHSLPSRSAPRQWAMRSVITRLRVPSSRSARPPQPGAAPIPNRSDAVQPKAAAAGPW